jgi:pyruvate dehydrogenase E2 component (dihydrolipoamide acetyltransferase)
MNQDFGTVVAWLKKEGDEVVQGEPLMEVETDKAVVQIEAPASGHLVAVTAAEGEEVPVGRVIAQVIRPGEVATTAPTLAVEGPSAPAAQPLARPPSAEPPNQSAGTRLQPASPKARRLAADRGQGLDEVAGSGPGGAVLAVDVLALASANAPEPLTTSRLWRVMAERTQLSWTTAPHFFLVREVEATHLVGWRSDLEREGLSVTFSDLLVRVVAGALHAHPRVNARWDDGLKAEPTINVALAVATPEGLVTPVIHSADRLSVSEISLRRRELIERARAGRLSPADLQGGTFTISNLGMYGVDAFSAILNGGQAAILAVGRIADRVLAVNGRPEVRPAIVLSLSCDHRVIDGVRGAEFLDTLTSFVEDPTRLT